MSQFSFRFQSSQKNVYITSSDLFTCWDQYVQVLTKGKFSFTAAAWLKWEKLQVQSSKICHDVQKWQTLKVNLKAHVKGMKGNLNLPPEKKVGIFTSQGVLTMTTVCLCHNCGKQQLFLLAGTSKPQPRHQDLAYSNAATERNFCQGSICMINCC